MREHGLGLHPEARNIRLEKDAVHFVDAGGKDRTVGADNVIVATGVGADTVVADELRSAGLDVQAFGDRIGVTYIERAMRGAAEAVTKVLAQHLPR